MKRENQWRASQVLEKLLANQKNLANLYNSAALEAGSKETRQSFFNILLEEHQLHEDIFMVMQRRGLYSPQPAEDSEIAQAYLSFDVAK